MHPWYVSPETAHLRTSLIQNSPAVLLSFLVRQVQGSLRQRVHVVSHVITQLTFSSATWRTFHRAFGTWVGCTAYSHLAVDENKGMSTNELKGFHAEPLSTRRRRWMIFHCYVTWAAKVKQISLIKVKLCLRISLTKVFFLTYVVDHHGIEDYEVCPILLTCH